MESKEDAITRRAAHDSQVCRHVEGREHGQASTQRVAAERNLKRLCPSPNPSSSAYRERRALVVLKYAHQDARQDLGSHRGVDSPEAQVHQGKSLLQYGQLSERRAEAADKVGGGGEGRGVVGAVVVLCEVATLPLLLLLLRLLLMPLLLPLMLPLLRHCPPHSRTQIAP